MPVACSLLPTARCGCLPCSSACTACTLIHATGLCQKLRPGHQYTIGSYLHAARPRPLKDIAGMGMGIAAASCSSSAAAVNGRNSLGTGSPHGPWATVSDTASFSPPTEPVSSLTLRRCPSGLRRGGPHPPPCWPQVAGACLEHQLPYHEYSYSARHAPTAKRAQRREQQPSE